MVFSLDFMERCCINRAAGNRMYFQVTADGRPLRQRRYCFSEGFYAIANAEYYGVTGDAQRPVEACDSEFGIDEPDCYLEEYPHQENLERILPESPICI